MKAIPNRPKDLEDIRTVAANYPDLDLRRIQHWVQAFGSALERPDLWDLVKPLLK